MPRIELTNGAWAEYRDATKLKNRSRKRIIAAGEVAEGGQYTQGMAFLDAMIVELVTAWSFELPLPSEDPESLDDLLIADYDLLAAAVEDASKTAFPSFSPDGAMDPSSPTEPSSASSGRSRADETTEPVPSPMS